MPLAASMFPGHFHLYHYPAEVKHCFHLVFWFFFFKWLLGGVYLHSGIFATGQFILDLIRFRELRPFK